MVASAESVNGTVTVENDTADGDRVSITPLSQNYTRVGPQVNTTVDGSTFSAQRVSNAPLYFIRVVHDGEAHYTMIRAGERANVSLTGEIDGKLVNESGAGQPGVRMALFSSYGPMVAVIDTGENGTFDVGPLKPNSTYYLQYGIDGVPYNETIRTSADGDDYRVVANEPTSNRSVLKAAGGSPASHVVQILPPENESSPVAVESISLRNTGERPFVGAVEITIPEGANATAAMYEEKRIPVTQRGRTVRINATVPPGESVKVGVAYPIDNQTLTRTVAYEPDTAAVVLQGYDLSAVEHSENLERGNSPIPLLVAQNVSGDNATISLELPASSGSSTDGSGAASTATPGDAGGGFDAPATPLLIGVLGAIGGGLLAYRIL